jgi:hypothetical protein
MQLEHNNQAKIAAQPDFNIFESKEIQGDFMTHG